MSQKPINDKNFYFNKRNVFLEHYRKFICFKCFAFFFRAALYLLGFLLHFRCSSVPLLITQAPGFWSYRNFQNAARRLEPKTLYYLLEHSA